MTAKEPFFCVPRSTRQTSEGPAEFPIFYYDTSVVMAALFVDRAAADAEIRGKGLRLAMTRGNRSVAVLAGYDYRTTVIGRYFESRSRSLTSTDSASLTSCVAPIAARSASSSAVVVAAVWIAVARPSRTSHQSVAVFATVTVMDSSPSSEPATGESRVRCPLAATGSH